MLRSFVDVKAASWLFADLSTALVTYGAVSTWDVTVADGGVGTGTSRPDVPASGPLDTLRS